jgi:hypothetical protein
MNEKFENLLTLSRALNIDTTSIANFISQSEINDCIKIYNELPIFDPATYDRATRKDYLMTNQDNTFIHDLFLPKLQKLFPDTELLIDGGNFTTWHVPVNPHTDGYQLEYKSMDDFVKQQSVLGPAVLVPLSTDTGKGTPHTVFFNQTIYGPAAFSERWSQTHNNLGDNFTNQPFDKTDAEYEKLNHIPDELLYGLSIEKVLPWEMGSAIVWHRSRVHASTKFVDFNSKLHLIFFINFKVNI